MKIFKACGFGSLCGFQKALLASESSTFSNLPPRFYTSKPPKAQELEEYSFFAQIEDFCFQIMWEWFLRKDKN
jgi:hypothetical protein